MPPSRALRSAVWPLADQGLVSLGVFAINILLARHLDPAEYGVYALMYGVLLGLQLFNSALLLYPLSVRGAVAAESDWPRLMGIGTVLVIAMSVPLSLGLAAAMLVIGRPDLIQPAVAFFLLWQLQETMRRGLFAQFRHRTAILGDGIGYVGQIAAVSLLTVGGALTLPNALHAMAACLALGALVQVRQVGIELGGLPLAWRHFKDFWSIGCWSLVNNLFSLLRTQIFPWFLAMTHGPAAAASFQAVLNLMNVPNPVVLGLCNIIPQTAAKGRAARGSGHAWRVTRGVVWLGAVPILAYYALVAAFPGAVLQLFYGSASPYVQLWQSAQILTAALAIGYVAEMICSYLHGIAESRLSLIVNALGAGTAALAGLPLTIAFGLVGSCAALIVASIVRTLAATYILARVTADDHALPA